MSDQLFHKRQRKEADLKRKKAFRKPAMRYLIVTEGEKTEPFYLAALRDHLRINRENLRIHPKKCGLDPSRLVELALEEHRNDPNYNIIFCVFDRDSHHHFASAAQRIHDLKGKYPIQAITSTPCFELWYLLHYKYTTKSYTAKGTQSLCDCLIKDLKDHIPDYRKNLTTYDDLLKLTDVAIENALKLESHRKKLNTDNPSTDVHKLVRKIQELRQR